ncbi:MAG: phosphate signaling complex protein PhoU [Candidatus Thorarchaeota archaeon]|nr:phosphate signaling complex protein PhoU [Candidatus Thorarchaeota archaeon]
MKTQLEFYLDEIQGRLMRLHELSEKAFMDSMESFKNLDQDVAKDVKDLAGDIDELEEKIEANVLETIGRRQPVASDLRRLSVYLQTAHNLHRVGRYAYKIAHITYLCKDLQHFKELQSIPYLAELAKKTLDIAMKGILNGDLSKMDELEKLESESDRETSDMFNEIVKYLREQNGIEEMALFYIIIGRYCERAADQAFQIAEKAVYMVKGKRVKLGLAYKGKSSQAPH